MHEALDIKWNFYWGSWVSRSPHKERLNESIQKGRIISTVREVRAQLRPLTDKGFLMYKTFKYSHPSHPRLKATDCDSLTLYSTVHSGIPSHSWVQRNRRSISRIVFCLLHVRKECVYRTANVECLRGPATCAGRIICVHSSSDFSQNNSCGRADHWKPLEVTMVPHLD